MPIDILGEDFFLYFFTATNIYFLTLLPGGDDKLVKVWDYMGGEVTHVGIAHGGSITSIEICSNNHILVSTSADGGIMRWAFPHPAQNL